MGNWRTFLLGKIEIPLFLSWILQSWIRLEKKIKSTCKNAVWKNDICLQASQGDFFFFFLLWWYSLLTSQGNHFPTSHLVGGVSEKYIKCRNLWARSLFLLLFSHSVVSDSLWPYGLQHARLPCPSTSPRACSNSCLLSRWRHPTILPSVVPFFSSCL